MKTWWNYLAAIAFALLIPFIIGMLPTFELKGKVLGGGPIRQFFINHAANVLPIDIGNIMINKFMESTVIGEYLLYLPIAVNISAITLLFSYCLCALSMNLQNYIKNQIYQSQRNKAKGA